MTFRMWRLVALLLPLVRLVRSLLSLLPAPLFLLVRRVCVGGCVAGASDSD
jgi:hypothetical protein